jgi:alpha-glucosidase
MRVMNSDALWLADQILYQIFPDRFAVGRPHTPETKLRQPEYNVAGYVHRRWEELPETPPRGRDFFGGDLRGIRDRLDHIQSLGATGLYLTPIFSAPSNHKYDTTDFFTVDPQFGGEPALVELVAELKRRGMRLILDAVFNHVSDRHPWFIAARAGQSPYRDFFTWRPDGRYECWRDFGNMPELNLANGQLQDLLWRGPDSVLQRYLALGIDGWRFDVAVDVGLPVARAMRETIRRAWPKAVLVGEVMSFGGDWCRGDEAFHGVMNYYFRDAVTGWLRGEISSRQVRAAMADYASGYGLAGALQSWNMLSSHDTARLRQGLPQAALRRLAVVAQFTLPGVPVIYYGEEIGMEGGDDPDCRRPMIWEAQRWDRETWEWYRQLIEIRRALPALRRGALTVLEADTLVFLRHTGRLGEVALVAINASQEPYRQVVFTPHSHLYHALPMKNLLPPGQVVTMQAGNLRLDLPGRSAAIFVPDDSRLGCYRFFKDRNRAG